MCYEIDWLCCCQSCVVDPWLLMLFMHVHLVNARRLTEWVSIIKIKSCVSFRFFLFWFNFYLVCWYGLFSFRSCSEGPNMPYLFSLYLSSIPTSKSLLIMPLFHTRIHTERTTNAVARPFLPQNSKANLQPSKPPSSPPSIAQIHLLESRFKLP